MWTLERRKEDLSTSTSVWRDIERNEFFVFQTRKTNDAQPLSSTTRLSGTNILSISSFFRNFTFNYKTKEENTNNNNIKGGVICNCITENENIGNLPFKGKINCFFCGERNYRINIHYYLFQSPLVIAMDNNEQLLETKWNYLKSQILPQIYLLQGEVKRMSEKNEFLITQFIITKIFALIKEQEDLQLHQLKSISPVIEGTQEFFHHVFGMEEPLLYCLFFSITITIIIIIIIIIMMMIGKIARTCP